MGGLRTLGLALVVGALVSGEARSEPVVWRWVIWAPGEAGDVLTNQSGPSPFAVGVVGNDQTSPAPGAAIAGPAVAAEPAVVAPPTSAMAIQPSLTAGPITPSAFLATSPAPIPPVAPVALPSTGPAIASAVPTSSWQTQSPSAAVSTGATAGLLAPAAPAMADAFINFGNGPFASADKLTSGNAQPWYLSPAVTQLLGGVPNAQQRADFTNTVLQRVEQTYQLSGVPVQLTTDPNTPAAHSVSVVSGTGSPLNSLYAGVTQEGGNGFSFIDKFAGAQSLDQLEWVVAHNIAHELMHAFGGEHHDTTGTYLDSATTPWSVMADPNARFSPAEVQDLLSHDFTQTTDSSGADGQLVSGLPMAAPEPASIAAWMLLGAGLALARGLRGPRSGG